LALDSAHATRRREALAMPPTIRLATPDDAEQVRALYAPYCHTPISFETEPPGVEDVRERLAKVLGQYPWLGCEDGDEVLGYAYATQHRERAAYCWSVDTSVYVRQGRQRRGVGRALYTSLLAVLPLQGYVNAYAGVTLPNPASVGLHEAMGFQPVGVYRQVGFKCGAWHDVGWFQRPLQPRPCEPAHPKRLEEVCHTEHWAKTVQNGLVLLHDGGATVQ
jgi:phosphinothricin acetyltransferase